MTKTMAEMLVSCFPSVRRAARQKALEVAADAAVQEMAVKIVDRREQTEKTCTDLRLPGKRSVGSPV